MSPFEGYVLLKEGSESRLREALSSHKLDPNGRFRKESFLAYAIKLNGQLLLQLLLAHGADPNLVSFENGRCEPAIITATRYKSFPSVQLLLQFGANPAKTNFYGTDVIFQAVHENAVDILDYILEHRQQGACLRGEACVQHSTEERDRSREHLLCPFNYALSRSHTSHGKRQTLLRLIQSYYQCRCLRELRSNKRINTISSSSLKMHRAKYGNRGTKGKVLYRIYEISCNWDEVRGGSAGPAPKTSYMALMGPLKLSYLAREVIRENLCPRSPTPTAEGTGGIHKANTFRRSLNALEKALPRSLTNFIAYRNIDELSSDDVKVTLMEIEGVPNVSFTVISI